MSTAAFKRWQSSARTHVGKVRLLNEDRYLDAPDKGLWVVADGMGGHEAGDVAATAVVQALARLCGEAALLSMTMIKEALQSVNRSLATQMRQRGQRGGCTVAGLFVSDDGTAHVFWAGDSRVYALRGHRLEQLSRDHSFVQEMLDAGLIDAAQAISHPRASVITRAVGAEDELQLEIHKIKVDGIDQFFLCSDGITNELTDTEIARCLLSDQSAISDLIVSQTMNMGARDNFTFVHVY